MRALIAVLLLLVVAPDVFAEQCSSALDMETGIRAGLEHAALDLSSYLTHNDAAGVQRGSNASLSANFAGVQTAMTQSQPVLGGAQATVRATYLLETGGTGTLERASFLCGVYGTPQFVSFTLNNLPAGRYGLVIEDVKGAKGPYYLTLILQQEAGAWKLAGLPPLMAAEAAGHDASWYLVRAREFKSSGQTRNAWFYYQQARTLAQPAAFMITTALVKLDREAQPVLPADLPVKAPVPLVAAGGKSFSLTQVFTVAVEGGLDLVVRYSTPDLADTGRAFQENNTVINTLVAKFPELRDGFQAVVARATDPAGRDYGTMVAMKDIK